MSTDGEAVTAGAAVDAVRGLRVIEIDEDAAATALGDALDWPDRIEPGSQARQRLTRAQSAALAAAGVAAVISLVAWPRVSGVVLMAIATATYLATIAHRVTAVRSALRHSPMMSVTDEEARAVPDHLLPTYCVLVPAFGEPEVVPDLIRSLERLEYPRERLVVKLLLEQDDAATLAAARDVETQLRVDVLVVPRGLPQTKPRALNYGLLWSTSELVTIYDAEDRPEPLQLRRAAVAMGRLGPHWACLQARLEFYESERNLLTRSFTLEYLTWFNLFLPGMVNQRGVVPLGGTSNHFRREALLAVGAWDPFNVTEDADLGIRLQRRGYRVGVLDSVTHEEPNGDVVNWVKQRSRWQKGYVQTALVHLRQPRRLVRELGWRGVFHLLLFVGGTPLLAVANLFFWSMSIFYLVTRAQFVEQLYPGPSFYLAVAAWGIGNFTIVYLGVATAMVTRRSDLLWAALLAPLYWILMSLAAVRALIQFISAPSFWEKTQHGLARPGVVDLTDRSATSLR